MSASPLPDSAMLERELINKFIKASVQIRYLTSINRFYEAIEKLIPMFDQINVKLIEDPQHFLKDTLLLLTNQLTSSNYKHPEKKHILQQVLEKVVLKIVEIFAAHRVDKIFYYVVASLFDKHSYLLNDPAPVSGSSMFRSRNRTVLYRVLLDKMIDEISKHPKVVWEMTLQEITDLLSFFNALEQMGDSVHCNLMDLFITQVNAFCQACRPNIMKSTTKFKAINLYEAMVKKGNQISLLQKAYFFGLNFGLLLLKSEQKLQKIEGIKIIDELLYSANTLNSDKTRKITKDRIVDWIQKSDVLSLIYRGEEIIDEVIENSQQVLRGYLEYKKQEVSKVKLVLELIEKPKITIIKKIQRALFKGLDPFYFQNEARQIVLEYYAKWQKYDNLSISHMNILFDLPVKSDRFPAYLEKLLNSLIKICLKSYPAWSKPQKLKMEDVTKKAYDIFRRDALSLKSLEAKSLFLQNLITSVLKEFSKNSIVVFNLLFSSMEFWKIISNNAFQAVIKNLVEKDNFYDRVFKYLDELADRNCEMSEKDNQEKEISKMIKFVSSKYLTLVDFSHKYIKTLIKYPQIYEDILLNEGYSSVEKRFTHVLELIKTQNVEIPFKIVKKLFIKSNHYYFVKKNIYEVTQNYNFNQEIFILQKIPNQLKFYDDLMSILMETQVNQMRKDISQFIASLYIMYTYDKHGSGNEELIKFMTEIVDNFINDAKVLKLEQSSKNKLMILSTLELSNQILQATDTYGVGAYPPHNSLVSISSIFISVHNNVTFGNDVSKVFNRSLSSNIILFDVLTLIGQTFKCGPEEIVLRQGKRWIPITMNGKILEELNLSNEQLTAQKNYLNFMQTPLLIQNHELTPIMRKAIGQIFNRFAYDGKMSICEVTNFVRQSSGSDVLSNDKRVSQIFENYDADNDGILLEADMLKYFTKYLTKNQVYYRDQIIKNMKNLRYRQNMTLFSEKMDISPRYYLMLRYRLCKNREFYQSLFSLVLSKDQQIASKTQELLLNLPTFVESNQLIEDNSLIYQEQFIRNYKLIRIQHELSVFDQRETQLKAKQLKEAQIQRFISSHQDEKIFQLLQIYHSKKEKTVLEGKSFIICLKILRNLLNIKNLQQIDLFNEDINLLNIPKLPNTIFFAEETKKALQTNNIINYQVVLVLQLTQSTIILEDILEGCFHNQPQIRKISCNFIFFWEMKTNWANNLFSIQFSEVNCEQWFSLLSVIIKKKINIDYSQILHSTVSILENRRENLTNTYDKLMNGYLQILWGLIESKKVQINEQIESVIFKLLETCLSPQNRTLLYIIGTSINEDRVIDYYDRMLSTILPSQDCQIRQTFQGIKNLGTICYMNSILQQFFMIEKFRSLILSRSIPSECKLIEMNGKTSVDDFMYQLQRMYYHLQSSQEKYIVPYQFCLTCKDFDGKPINIHIQEDSHEFLNKIIQNSENAFKKDSKLEEFQKILQAKTLGELECQQCKNKIEKVQTAYCLMLEVKNQDSLESSLKKFTSTEEIEDYFCQKCAKKVKKVNKNTYIHQLPEIAIFNLQRIIYDAYKGVKIKVHSRMSFPRQINFQQYMKNNDLQSMNTKYRLKGVVIHTGTSEGGHYYSIINTENGWYKFNDQNVTPFDEADLERQSFGGNEVKDEWSDSIQYSTNAYILFYERFNLEKTAVMEVENIFSDQISQQNVEMVAKLQIHQECFFDGINYLIEKQKLICLEEVQKIEANFSEEREKKYCKLLNINLKAVNFLEVFTSVKSQTKKSIFKNITTLFCYLPICTRDYLKTLNFNIFLDNLIKHSDNNYRKILQQIFFTTTKLYSEEFSSKIPFSEEEDKSLLHMYEKLILELIGERLHKNIYKSVEYFELIKKLVLSSDEFKALIVEKNIIFILLDFSMGKDSLYTKYQPRKQDVPPNLLPIVFQIIQCILIFRTKNMNISQKEQISMMPLDRTILKNNTFYKRIMKENIYFKCLSTIIQIYSRNSITFTIFISELFIQLINDKEVIDIPQSLFLYLQAFLEIKDDLQEARYSFIFGIPQYQSNTPKGSGFCLPYSDRSQYLKFVSGLYSNRAETYPRLSLMAILIADKHKHNLKNLFILKLLLSLANQSPTFLDYIVTVPPTTYIIKSHFEWIEEFIGGCNSDHDFIIDNKSETISIMNLLYFSLLDKISSFTDLLPIQKWIIGKDVKIENIEKDQIEGKYDINLSLHHTYVLPNLPDKDENKSMPKNFFSSHDPKGIANCFVSYRSKPNYDVTAKQKNIEVKPTVYIVSGRTDATTLLIWRMKTFRYVFLLQEGRFELNFPFTYSGKIEDLLEIQTIKQEKNEEKDLNEVKALFSSPKKESIPKGQMIPEANYLTEPTDSQKMEMKAMTDDNLAHFEVKLTCKECTYDNQITATRCLMCEGLLDD